MAENQAVYDLIRTRIDGSLATPAYRQIYARVREAILHGSLPPGTRLPSSRSLANQLSMARGTVELAYELLAGEGYIIGKGAAGTFVDPQIPLPENARQRAGLPGKVEPRQGNADLLWETPLRPFQMGIPALDAFPRKLWSRLAAHHARGLSAAMMTYQDPAGWTPLRRAIVNYLAIARGISCVPHQVFITTGFTGALALIAHVVLQRGDPVWLEDPGYVRTREALRSAGADIVPVPVDDDGLDVDAGIEAAERARLAIVTPSHQAPLGMTLSLSRRLALLAWAEKQNGWIVEDDYDSEFRYRGRPPPALKSLDEAGRVLYVGTFSKVLLPSLRLGYLVVPASQVERFAHAASFLMPSSSLIAQMTVAEFITQGHFSRHIKRMRKLYADRRSALSAALANIFGERVQIQLGEGGMHLVMRFQERVDDVAFARRAGNRGLGPIALSPWALNARCGPGLLLSFTNIPVHSAMQAARRLRSALDD